MKEELETHEILKLDTKKNGLEAIWKPYEIEALHELIDHGERTSGEVWAEINLRVEISRASVIFFLNRLVNAGLASFRMDTGKGGHHRVYSLDADNWDALNETVIDRILYKLWEIFPNSERVKLVIA